MNMKNKAAATMAALAGIGMLAIGGVAPRSVSAQAPASPAPGARPARGHRERHPEIRRALRNLEQAKMNLQRASKDFGGHREQALDLTQKAIEQCNLALASDKN